MKHFMKSVHAVLTSFILLSIPLVLMCCFELEDDLVSQNCTDHCTTISGRLLTNNGADGIGDVRLTAKWKYSYGIEAGGIIRTKAIGRTDANGNYSLTFAMRDDEIAGGYFLVEYEVNESEYLTFANDYIFFPDLKPDSTATLNYLIPKKAFIKCSVLNTAKLQPADYFATEFTSYMGHDGRSRSGSVLTWSSGFSGDVTVGVAGNQPLYLKTYKRINEVYTTKYDTVTIIAGQTIGYTFDFNE